MNIHFLSAAALVLAAGMADTCAQSVTWGSPLFTHLYDSKGVEWDHSINIQLGYFSQGFSPDTLNTADWGANWNMIDSAVYNPLLGYFTSDVAVSDLAALEQSAFVWIHNSTVAEAGSEWLLTRGEWTYSDSTVGCCDKTLADQWSMSETATTPPVWGGQDGLRGGGTFTSSSGSLQTYGFESSSPIPEVSSSLIGIAIMFGLAMKRRRPGCNFPAVD